MPSEEPDPAKYLVGGCCPPDEMPDYRCIKCSTEFDKKSNESRNRFITDTPKDFISFNEVHQSSQSADNL
jgi:hypothetical protein